MTNLEKLLNNKVIGKYTITLTYFKEFKTKAAGSFSTNDLLEFLKVVSFAFNDGSVIFAQTYQNGKRVHFSKTKETFFDAKKNTYFLPHSVLRKFEERRN